MIGWDQYLAKCGCLNTSSDLKTSNIIFKAHILIYNKQSMKTLFPLIIVTLALLEKVSPQARPAVVDADMDGIPAIEVEPVGTPELAGVKPMGDEQIIEIQQQSKTIEEENEQLPDYLKTEMQQAASLIEMPITESFTFTIDGDSEVEFKWDPSKDKELKLNVDVFSITSQGYVQAIQDPEEFEFVQVLEKSPKHPIFSLLAKVYRKRMITVYFNSDYVVLKFINKNAGKVLVQVDVQALEFVVEKGVEDDILESSRKKVANMISEAQSTEVKRQHLYKWQWGYYQTEKFHQIKILGLTGVELMAILVTSCTQMYCLRSILDNRAIV